MGKHACVSIHVCMSVRAWAHVYMHACMRVSVHACVHARTSACMHMCACMRVCVHDCVHGRARVWLNSQKHGI